MGKLTHNVPVNTSEGTRVVQTLLKGGTATLQAKLAGMSEFSTIKELAEGFEHIAFGEGQCKVLLTGNAEVGL
tara:strand:+ start:309 stop:527 length:219 start_codon:yes stop_codon:yes gene_type:complete